MLLACGLIDGLFVLAALLIGFVAGLLLPTLNFNWFRKPGKRFTIPGYEALVEGKSIFMRREAERRRLQLTDLRMARLEPEDIVGIPEVREEK